MSKILIYTQNVHDLYTGVIVDFLLQRKYEVLLISPKINHTPINNMIRGDKIQHYTLVNRLNTKRRYIPRLLLKVLNIFVDYVNCVRLYRILKLGNYDKFIILDSYNKYMWFPLALFYPKKAVSKTILTVHNIHHHIKSESGSKWWQARIAQFSSEYIVLTTWMKEALSKHTSKSIHVIPFSVSVDKDISRRLNYKQKLENYPIRFVIPGNVSHKRKPYIEIFESFSRYSNDIYSLTLLGKIEDPSIIRYAKINNINIEYFWDKVSDIDFDRIMSSSHFSIGFVSDKLPYGTYKASGVSFDGPKYGVPTLINKQHLITEKGVFHFIESLDEFLETVLMEFDFDKYFQENYKIALNKMKANKITNIKNIDILQEE